MKKLLFYTMSIGMMILFSSCGNGGQATDKTSDSTAKEQGKDISEMSWDEKVKKLNTDCGDPANCGDSICELTSERIHRMSAEQFSAGIAAYYSRKPIPPAKKMPVSEIAPLVQPACDQYRIQYDLGHDSSTHSEIEFRIASGYRRPAGETNSYSVAMFKGILKLTPAPDTFHLYRGLGGQYGNLVSLYLMVTSGPDTIYLGDLSDAFPLDSVIVKK